MHPASRSRPRTLLAAAVFCASAACHSGDPRTVVQELRARATPTMEEIFLIPGIQGRAPSAEQFTADGRWVFFRYNPLETGADGTRSISDVRALRVQSTLAPESTTFAGQRVDDLLPTAVAAAAGSEKPSRSSSGATIALSHHGARVLAQRDQEIFLLDAPPTPAGNWLVRTLLRADPDGVLKKLEFARFSEEDDAVLVDVLVSPARDGAEMVRDLWKFPLRPETPAAWPLAANDGVNVTAAIEEDSRKLTFSRDLLAAFIPASETPAKNAAPAEQVPGRVVWIASGKTVELADTNDLKAVESTQLSPDGRFLFGNVVYKSEKLHPTLIPDYLSTRVTTQNARTELADDGPAPRKLFLWSTETGAKQSLALGEGDAYWLRRIGWAPKADPASPPRLALARLSEDFHTLETYVWSETTGLVKVFEDHDERWIGGPLGGSRWSGDGARLLFGSESMASSTLPGRAQLFAFDVATSKVRQLTQASGEVSYFDEARDGGIVFNYCDADDTERRKLAYIAPTGKIAQLDAPVGFNADPQIALDGALVVFQNSRLFQPAELWSVDARKPEPARLLTRTTPPEFLQRDWIHPVSFEVTGERDAKVRSHVFLPRTSALAHPDRARACIVFIHGAGFLQNVTDSMTEYPPNLLFHSRLAGEGYVVVDVDYRGSEGYGQDFRTAVQYHLGGLELSDIHATLDALAARGVIDPKRVGCYGGSYGGFLTLMALFTAGERWSAGAALRSVTDWRTYTPEYTQPRLGRPSQRPDAYALSSPIDHAEGLTKPLLLLHGLMDDNVFAQDTIRLMEKLIGLGKDFEAMLYPSQKHAFTDGAHWLDEYKRIEKFMMEHLGAP